MIYMKHRIFVAINLPEDIKTKISTYELKWPELPCKWVKKDNLHITLAFLGYLTDEELVELCRITQGTALEQDPFIISFKKITYGPNSQLPKMVWLTGENNKELESLRKKFQKRIEILPIENEKESRHFSAHITMGRLKQWEFKALEQEERPEVNEDVNFTFEAESIEIMESDLQRKGPEYSILESFKLG
jgi:RNA 2',3'-cyclic 3'-phosphodiesterase